LKNGIIQQAAKGPFRVTQKTSKARLMATPEKFALTRFACFERQGLTFRRYDCFSFAGVWEERLAIGTQ
jgi:hypothetical protein